jgi:type VI secretion system secreted protein Hcp
MSRFRHLWVVSALSAAVSLASGVAMAQTSYLNVDGVQGASVDASHRSWIEIDSFSFDSEQALNIGSQGAGAGAGKAKFNPFTITKKVDSASPLLLQAITRGTHLKTVILEMKRTSGGKTTYYRATMSDVVVKKVTPTPAATPTGTRADESPKEQVTFEYGGLQIRYAPSNADGTPGPYGEVPNGFDFKANLRP